MLNPHPTDRPLREGGSGAGEVCGSLRLDRAVIRLVLMELQDQRKLQATFCSMVRGARFKYFESGVLLHTVCRIQGPEGGGQTCGATNSLDPMIWPLPNF